MALKDILALPTSVLQVIIGSVIIGSLLARGLMQFYRGYRMKAVTYKQDAKDKFDDVIILGAGPASLSVAIQLMNSPEVKSIIILERMQKDFILPPLKQNENSERIYADPALFTQVINDKSKSYLKQLGVLKPIEDLGVVSVQNQSFISPKKIEFTIQKDVLMTTRQRILLGLYSQIANSKKVRIFWKALFQSLKFIPEEGIWTVSYTDINGSEMNRRARLVVVADGAHCDACSQLSLITSYFKPPNGFLLSSKLITEKYFPKQSSTNFNQIQTLTTSFSDGIVPGFSQYITNTQNEAKTNDLCIAFTNTTAGGQPVSQLIDQIFPHSQEEKMNTNCEIRMIRMTGHIFQPHLNHLIVVGGAAALCGPEGEEMEYALQSAGIAAGAIQEAFHRKNWGIFVLSRLYGNKIQKEIKNKMKRAYKFAVKVRKDPLILDALILLIKNEIEQFRSKDDSEDINSIISENKIHWIKQFIGFRNGEMSFKQIYYPSNFFSYRSAYKRVRNMHDPQNNKERQKEDQLKNVNEKDKIQQISQKMGKKRLKANKQE